MELSHVRLLVAGDFNAMFRFYLEKIGLPTTYRLESSGPYAEFELGGNKYLGLFERRLMQEAIGGSGAPHPTTADDRFALCFGVADVDIEAERLARLGVTIAVPAANHEPWGMRTTYVRDPEGNLIEFYSPLKP